MLTGSSSAPVQNITITGNVLIDCDCGVYASGTSQTYISNNQIGGGSDQTDSNRVGIVLS